MTSQAEHLHWVDIRAFYQDVKQESLLCFALLSHSATPPIFVFCFSLPSLVILYWMARLPFMRPVITITSTHLYPLSPLAPSLLSFYCYMMCLCVMTGFIHSFGSGIKSKYGEKFWFELFLSCTGKGKVSRLLFIPNLFFFLLQTPPLNLVCLVFLNLVRLLRVSVCENVCVHGVIHYGSFSLIYVYLSPYLSLAVFFPNFFYFKRKGSGAGLLWILFLCLVPILVFPLFHFLSFFLFLLQVY